jgi:RNA polymerase I-specific transcription initiation factor RRN7
MLQPEELPKAISYLAMKYQHTFGLTLPRLNHEILLHRYVLHLALPLEIFPAVQRLARISQSLFRYSVRKEARRKQGSAFPELQLMSLLVIAVKLLYPFDKAQHHTPSAEESVVETIDWVSWKQHRQELAKLPRGASMAPGSQIDVCDTDVFKMSQQELDSYMDWYQRTWVKEPRPGFDDHVSKAILDMFPLGIPETAVKTPPMRRERDLEDVATRRTQATTASMKFHGPAAEEEESHQQLDASGPGKNYTSYKTEKDLPDSAKAFFGAAAETACTLVKNLILAVLEAEAKIATWKRAKRRAEVTGRGLDLSAEMRGGRDERLEARMQQDMEAMNIQEDIQSEESEELEEGEESGRETSDTDMHMIS